MLVDMSTDMSSPPVDPAPTVAAPALTGLTPYLYYPDVDDALDWLERVLGFGPVTRWTHDERGTVEARIGVGPVNLDMTRGQPGPDRGAGLLLIVHVDDVDRQHARVAAQSGPSRVVSAPRDEPYGPRAFDLTDPWGYRWYFWQGDATPPTDTTTTGAGND